MTEVNTYIHRDPNVSSSQVTILERQESIRKAASVDARQTFFTNMERDSKRGVLTPGGRELAGAVLSRNDPLTPDIQVFTFAVDGVQSISMLVVKRDQPTAEGPNILLYMPNEEGESFHEFNDVVEMNSFLKSISNSPAELEKFARHFSHLAPPGQVDRVKDTMLKFANNDIGAVVGAFGCEKEDVFTRLNKGTIGPPVQVNGLTNTFLHAETQDGRVTFIGSRPNGEQVLYSYDAYGNLHGGDGKGNFYFVKDGLNNNEPLIPMSLDEYGKQAASVSFDNVGADDLKGLLEEFYLRLKNPGHGIGTALTVFGVPESIAFKIENGINNPGEGLAHINVNNWIGDLLGIDEQTVNSYIEQAANAAVSFIPQYDNVDVLSKGAATVLGQLLLTPEDVERLDEEPQRRKNKGL
jgi:hypothetical protein